MSNFILLKNGIVYAPEYLGKKDILIGGNEILDIASQISVPKDVKIDCVDLDKKWVIPGLIDSHIHIAGAGGEGGPGTRTAELSFEKIVSSGITSVVGCLGTDGYTRRVDSVLMKAKGLKQQGISAWIYTGAYQVPPPTITGSVARDLSLIDEVIGVGEIAISDHRSSYPTENEFIKLIQEAKIGGLIGGKCGIINLHLGDEGKTFELVDKVTKRSGISRQQFLPTHCNRSKRVFSEAMAYGKEGRIDLTTSSYPYYPDIEVKPSEGFFELLEAGIPVNHITMSSDSGGSLPIFDGNGNFLKSENGNPGSIYSEMQDIFRQNKSMLSKALQTVTSNVADILQLPRKGRIQRGNDADLLVITEDDLKIQSVYARGKRVWQEAGADIG